MSTGGLFAYPWAVVTGDGQGEISGADGLRNVGVVAHINAGKTTLTERVLYTTGKQSFMGEVDDGTATMDFLAEEQRRGISITAAVTRVGWQGYRVNVIDTPGHVDFTAEVERCLRVMDGVVVVLDAVRGVESQTETVWRQADAWDMPRLVLVNKMDRAGADFEASVDAVREVLGGRAVPVVAPLFADGEFAGLVDVVFGRVQRWRDSTDEFDLRAARAVLLEACADFDESILRDFVDERPVEGDRVVAALRQGVMSGEVVPVLAGAALHNRGVAPLLDAVCRYLPSPMDAGGVSSLGGEDPAAVRRPRRDDPFCGLVFKSHVEVDESFSVARLYSGSVSVGDAVARGSSGDQVNVESLWLVHADHREPLDEAGPGDVVAMKTTSDLRTGDTLYAPGHPIELEPLRFPRPVLTATLEPRLAQDGEAVEAAARALCADDPTLIVSCDADRGGLVVSGMGELHLEVFGSRLSRRIGDRARLGRPTVAYMETVARAGAGRAECRRAGEGSMASVVGVEVEPLSPGEEARVEISCEAQPGRCDALAEGLEQRLRHGLADPYPAMALVLRLVEVAGDAAGDEGVILDLEALSVACRKAVAAAGAQLLEPSMEFEVVCPGDGLSGVLADLKSRVVEINSVTGGDPCEVRGTVALRAVLGYPTQLRSLTRGLGTVSLTPSGYIPADGRAH